MRGQGAEQPAHDHVDLAVEVFRMIADATRVRLLWALLEGELPVNELAQAVGKPAAGVFQHLAKLRMARLAHPTPGHPDVLPDRERPRPPAGSGRDLPRWLGVPEHHRSDSGVRTLTRPTRAQKVRPHDPHRTGSPGPRSPAPRRPPRPNGPSKRAGYRAGWPRCSARTATTPPNRSTLPWSPAPTASAS